jgi:hypothetical protein
MNELFYNRKNPAFSSASEYELQVALSFTCPSGLCYSVLTGVLNTLGGTRLRTREFLTVWNMGGEDLKQAWPSSSVGFATY